MPRTKRIAYQPLPQHVASEYSYIQQQQPDSPSHSPTANGHVYTFELNMLQGSENVEAGASAASGGGAHDGPFYFEDHTVGVSDRTDLIGAGAMLEPSHSDEHETNDRLNRQGGQSNTGLTVDLDDSDASVFDLARKFAKHCHVQIKPPVDRNAERTLMVISVLTMGFMIGEFTGGYLAHSLAVMTDAGHLLSDLFSFLISLIAIWIGRWPATRKLSFGFHRAEVLGAMLSIVIIWVITGILVYLAVQRCIDIDSFEVHGNTMAITAACAVVFNVIMGLVLHFGGAAGLAHHHGHSHGIGSSRSTPSHSSTHSHSHNNGRLSSPSETSPDRTTTLSPTEPDMRNNIRSALTVNLTPYPGEEIYHTRRQRNINVRAAFVHVLGDLLQSVGVLIAAVVVWIKPEYKLVDPICTFVFSVLVLITTLTVMRDAVLVLMEGTPRDVQYSAVYDDLMSIEGVRAVHNLHVWSLTMDKAALAVHLAIDAPTDPLKVMLVANQIMRRKYNLSFTTVQVEPYDELLMTNCRECLGPTS